MKNRLIADFLHFFNEENYTQKSWIPDSMF
jgi:hypothetical protein